MGKEELKRRKQEKWRLEYIKERQTCELKERLERERRGGSRTAEAE